MKIYKNAKLSPSIKLDWDLSWYLYGTVGGGKTHNAYALVKQTNLFLITRKEVNEAENKFYDYPFMTFVNFAHICDRLRNAPLEADVFAEDSRRGLEHDLIHKKKLVIDDLGSEKRSDYSDDFLMRLVEHRYSNDLYTGFTSNHDVPDLGYDKRILSRIVGMVGKNKFHLQTKDWRIK